MSDTRRRKRLSARKTASINGTPKSKRPTANVRGFSVAPLSASGISAEAKNPSGIVPPSPRNVRAGLARLNGKNPAHAPAVFKPPQKDRSKELTHQAQSDVEIDSVINNPDDAQEPSGDQEQSSPCVW